MKITSYKKENDITYSLGATVTMEYLNVRPDLVEGVIIHPRFDSSDTMSKINDICSSRGITVEVSEKPFNILSKKGNCFVIGVIRKQREEIGQGSCAGFGITDIAVVPPAVDMYDPKTVRASMGARARVRMELFESFEEYEKRFPANHIYPFMLDGSTLLQNTKIESPFSLVFGNEASGLPQKFQKKGHPIRIEHTNNIDSLNLPTAAGIAVFEATRSVFGS